jgi:PhzF family phenazine biosynthesis protein
MKIRVYRLSSFTDKIDGGNPAGVVLNADNLKEGEMKYIAKEVGYSETAFVLKSDKADFKVRFFTPVK